MQDPLSSIPHQTFQAHRAAKVAHPSLPTKPSTQAPDTVSATAVVTAAPELRDFKKEATAFVPAALKRKRPGAAGAVASKINAAPSVDVSENADLVAAPRPDLLSTLKAQLGPAVSTSGEQAQSQAVTKSKDDYEKFLDEMGDILGPKA
jgi:hypothetical protein